MEEARKSELRELDRWSKMATLSLYRGNMHRVPDMPRRWLMPDQNIPFKSFKVLHYSRMKALSLLGLDAAAAASSKPNPNLSQLVTYNDLVGDENEKLKQVEVRDRSDKETDGSDCEEKVVGGSGSLPESEAVTEAEKAVGQLEAVNAMELVISRVETNGKVQELSEKEKRRKEAEEKLQDLNEKKHGLVQLLKQILNAEEEMKRRSSMQAAVNRPMPSLTVDVQNDLDPTSRHDTPRSGSEKNHVTDMEGVEAHDMPNHMAPTRPLHRMSSSSPSSESPYRRAGNFQHNTSVHPARSPFGAASCPSPSRFAPIPHLGDPSTPHHGHPSTPQHGHPSPFPTVSVSGTNYIASSPSPAASGGTPIFKDARHPSPWS